MTDKVEVRMYLHQDDVLVIDAITMTTGESRGEVIKRFMKQVVDAEVHKSTLITNALNSKGLVRFANPKSI